MGKSMIGYTTSTLATTAGVSVHVVRDYMVRGLVHPTRSPASRTSALSSLAVRKCAACQVAAPSQALSRRLRAQTLHRPSSPSTRRPRGRSTRAISRTAAAASVTKHRTVTAATTSKLASGKGSRSTCPCRNVTLRPAVIARARAAPDCGGDAHGREDGRQANLPGMAGRTGRCGNLGHGLQDGGVHVADTRDVEETTAIVKRELH